MNSSGIYCWRTPRGLYVGSAVNIEARRAAHLKLLRKSRHCNKFLQHAFDKYGDAFQFEILLVCDPSDLLRCEQHFIDTLKPRYNISPVAGSQLGFKHSRKTKEKVRALSRAYWADPIARNSQGARAKDRWARVREEAASHGA